MNLLRTAGENALTRTARVLALAVTYFAAARLGLLLASVNGSVSPVWPATGLAIWALLAGGQRLWPAIALGAFIANATSGASWAVAVAIAIGNTLEAVWGAHLVALCRRRARFGVATEAVAFLLAAVVAPIVSASIGVCSLRVAGAIPVRAVPELWLTWWVGDALGALSIAPLAHALAEGARDWRGLSGRAAARAAGLLCLALGVSWLVFYSSAGAGYLLAVFPVLLLGAAWFDAAGVRLVACLICAAAILAAFLGSGPFTGGTLNDDLLRLQLFLTSVAAAALVLPIFRRMGELLLPSLVLLFGWLLSAWLFSSLHGARLEETRRHFEASVLRQEAAIHAGMDLHEDALRGAIGLFEASRSVESSEWSAYVRALQLPERYVAFGALAVVEGSPSAPLTDTHRLEYLEPKSFGPDRPGMDYASESVLRDALNAGDTQRALLTAPRALSAAPTQSPRFDRWLVLAVPAKDSALAERAPGRRFWICAPLALDVLMRDAISGASRELQVQLYEGTSIDPKQLIYSTASSEGVGATPELTTQLELGQRPFTVVWSKGPSFAETDLTAPLYAATGSAFVTLLLAGLVMTLSSLSKRASALAATRTLELADVLRLQRAVLDGTTLSVIATDPAGVIQEFNTGAEKMLGYRRAEIVGLQTPEILHDPAEVIDRSIALSGELNRLIEPGFGVFVARAELGEMDEREWTYVRNDGGRVPVLLSVTALRDVDGHITGYLGIARDLTESKRAARALSESEQRNRLFAEHAPAAVAMFDTDMRYLVVSRQWIEDYQLAGREIIGASHYEVFPEVSAHWKGLHQRCLAGETLTHEADLFERSDGERQWLSWRVQPWYSGPGRIGGIVMFTADITERVEANRALAASEQRVRLATEAAEVGVWEWDVAERRVLWDAQMFRMYGFQPTSDGSVPYELWCDAIHPEDRDEHQSTLRTALAHGSRSSREFRIHRGSDGMVRHLHSVETLSSDAGHGSPRIVGVSRDVTSVKLAEAALRESEERWKFALEGSGHGVWDWDLERGETFYSKQWRVLFGYDEHEVISETWQERIHPDDLASAVATLDRHRTQPDSGHYEHEYRLRRKDGRYRWISARGKVVLANAEGRALRMLGTHTDVTQRKELEQTLADARDQAIEASRLKSEFLANMSHEIRTPMNGVIGMTELLLDAGLTPEQQEMGRIIRSSADSLLVIINDILDLSKIEAGKLNVSPEEFDPNALFHEALLPLAPAARDKGIALGIEFAGGPLPWLFGDPVRIRQVLTNLISNAIKFTQTGEVQVVVCTLGETETDLGLQVEVRDTGIGIPREAQERLFQPFTQAEGGTTRRFGGTGLGLAISRRLVELMGGSVGFESELGRGSRFWFQLQLAKFDQRQAPSLPPLPLPLRALAVGQGATNRELIASQLRAWGVHVDTVETGTAALQRSHDQLQAGAPYDVALLEAALPDIEVKELALRIHAQPFTSHIPLVLVLSGRVQPDDSRLKAADFAAVLLEPVRKRTLHSTLLRVLREAQLAGPTVAESGPLPAARVLRVLIAEDNRTNQIVVSRLLGKLGHHSEIAADGKEALALLAQSHYDVVLMDCQMPEVDGYMATQKIRAGDVPGIDPLVPIIALTAHAMPADREKCLAVGMNDYVSKPLGLQDLTAALDRLGLGQTRKYDVA